MLGALAAVALLACPVAGLAQGTVVAWGDNSYGQTTVPAGLSGVTAIAAGNFHTVALKGDGTVVAWGYNTYGQTTVPAGLSEVTEIAAGYGHTVALKADEAVVAWGSNYYGETTVPAGLSEVTAIAAGYFHTVALKADGTVVAWGLNTYGETTVPAGLSGVTAIAAGRFHTVALKGDGTVLAWGGNYWGQTTVPEGLSGVTAIAAGYFHTVALKADGTMVAWGRNDWGQTTVPAGLTGVTAIAAGENYTVALKGDGTVLAWGGNYWGQTTVPAGLSGVTAIAAGAVHTVALVVPPNQPPTAVAGANQSIHAGTVVNLTGSASFDDNTPSATLLYSWSFALVPAGNTAVLANANTATPSFTPNVTGDYDVQLIVTDEGGLASAPSIVTLSSFNQAPTAVATATPLLAVVGQTVSLNGTASTDPETDPLTYAWTLTAPLGSVASIINATSVLTSLTPDKPGTYTLTLTVSDFLGAGTPATVSVEAITASSYAEAQIVAASTLVQSLPVSQMTNTGNQNGLGELLQQVANALQKGDTSKAVDKLDDAIKRTDGFPLRGKRDTIGESRDWIVNAAAQSSVYNLLAAARSALIGL